MGALSAPGVWSSMTKRCQEVCYALECVLVRKIKSLTSPDPCPAGTGVDNWGMRQGLSMGVGDTERFCENK